jgi:hypothetical protein
MAEQKQLSLFDTAPYIVSKISVGKIKTLMPPCTQQVDSTQLELEFIADVYDGWFSSDRRLSA